LEPEASKDTLEKFLKLLHPFCPHLTEELWEKLGNKQFISTEKWPEFDVSKIDLKAEAAEELILTTISDIKSVLKLINKESPKEITLIISESWKYPFMTAVKKELSATHNAGEILKSLMSDPSMKKYGQEISKLVPRLASDMSKIPETILSQDTELSTLKNAESILKTEFNTSIRIIKAEESKEAKAKQAMPSKPAILIE
jgi:leucyl-tRNA synthetase